MLIKWILVVAPSPQANYMFVSLEPDNYTQCSANSNISFDITFSPRHILAARCTLQEGSGGGGPSQVGMGRGKKERDERESAR